jgi:flagellar hook assembly protein FlgD
MDGREFGISQEAYSFYDFKIEGGEYFTYKLSSQFVSGTISVVDTAQIQSIEPIDISLSANFPNPFNSDTKIIFGLSSPQKLSLKIYDITGQLVKTLIDNEVLEARYHHLLWDGSNNLNQSVSSGTYYLQLTAEGTQKMMKMLYLK